MTQFDHVRGVGPFELARPMDRCVLGQRWLARHVEQQTDWMLIEFGPVLDKFERVMVLSWLDAMDEFVHPHLPAIRRVVNPYSGSIWAAEPFFGSEDGLLTLGQLVELKGGRMPAAEAERALSHMLDAMRYAHERGVCHGPLCSREVLVDRHGSLSLDLYGLGRRMSGLIGVDEEIVRDEIRSAAMMGYWALTGLAAEEPLIKPSRLVRKLEKAWDEWFEAALDPAFGFSSAAEASAALPSAEAGAEVSLRPGAARVMLDRLRLAVRPGGGVRR